MLICLIWAQYEEANLLKKKKKSLQSRVIMVNLYMNLKIWYYNNFSENKSIFKKGLNSLMNDLHFWKSEVLNYSSKINKL